MKTFQFLYKQKIYYVLNSTLKIDLLSKQPFHKFTFFNTFFTLYNFMQNWSNFVFYLQHYKFIKCIYFINFHSFHERTDYLFRKENYFNLTITITYFSIKLICEKKHVEIIFCKFLLSLLWVALVFIKMEELKCTTIVKITTFTDYVKKTNQIQ